MFFPRAPAACRLPRKVRRWLALHGSDAREESLVTEAGGERLFLRQYRPHPRESIALHLEVTSRGAGESARRNANLTRRENEVLHWLEFGKSNREIAEILGVKPGTVGKHLERIYVKLGVENWTAAASFFNRASA